MDWNDFDAALFDLDGVITPTAEIHMRAWSEMFNAFLAARGVPEPYTDDDYFAHVDGRPRYEGVETFLASRGIELPYGSSTTTRPPRPSAASARTPVQHRARPRRHLPTPAPFGC